jgi:hypothetical protein
MSYNEYGFTSPEENTSPPIDTTLLRASFEKEEKKEYPKSLSTNPLIAKVQSEIYGLCGIDVNTENNSWTKRLAKGFLDGSIFSKAELIHMIGNLNPEEIKKVALYILSNIGSILSEIAMSIPNGLKWLLSKNTYDAGISLAELIPTNKFVSIACAPVGIALKKVVPTSDIVLKVANIRTMKTVAEREAHLSDLMKKPTSNAEQLRKDILAGAIDPNHWDIEARIFSLFEMNAKDREQYIREGAIRIGAITNPSEKQKAIEEFWPWKTLAMKFTQLEGQKYNATTWVLQASENRVETGIRRQL